MDILTLKEKLYNGNFIVTDFTDNNIRAELKYNQALVGIYYFVIEADIFDNKFDLTQFQEQLLAKDYYRNRGYLQWNYYVVFVSDDEKLNDLSMKEKERKAEIERDVIFSRKYVVGPSGIDHIIQRTNFEIFSKLGKNDVDMSTVWIRKLREAQLDGIYLDEQFKRVTAQYIKGDPIIESKEVDDNDKDIITDGITFIKKIHIKQYRRIFPQNKTIEFKKINLIKGPNGVGKTSLLEALELVICGRTFRSGNKQELDTNLEAEYCGIEDVDVYKYKPGDNKKYRERDSKWYGNSGYSTGSKLSESFNRYNFYDTDAAYRFAYNTDAKAIKNAFYLLALGEKTNFIDSRLEKFDGYFKAEYRKLDDRINELRDSIKEREDTIEKIALKATSPEIFFKQILIKLKKIKWIGDYPEDKDEEIVLLENNLSILEGKIKSIIKNTSWLDSLTRKDLLQHYNYHKTVVELDDEINKKGSNLKIAEEGLDKLDAKYKTLLEAEPYFKEEGIEKLGYIKGDISNLEIQSKRYTALCGYLKDIDFDIFKDINNTVEEYGGMLDKERIRLEGIKDDNEKRIEKIKNSINEMRRLLGEIRFSANKMLELEPDLENCPLCNASYEKGELSKRIEKHSMGTETSGQLESFLQTRIDTREELGIVSRRITDYRNMLKAFNLVFNNRKTYLNKPISNIVFHLEEEIKLLHKETSKLEGLYLQLESFSAKGLEVEEYKILNQKFGEFGFNISYNNRQEYINRKKTINSELVKTKDQILKIKDEIEERKNRIINIWEGYSNFYDCGPYDRGVVRGREKELKNAIILVDESRRFVSIDDDVALHGFITAIEEVESGITNFKKSKASVEESKILTDEIRKYKDIINELDPKYRRAKKAKDVIEELRSSYSKESALKKFLLDNTEAIINIYSRIHTPYEGFTDISMDEDGIVLHRKWETVQINEISTGQRTALYISIFMVLNCSLKNGPPYIIFDDPIAHVDDLNILTFLDFLRDVALYGNKQVFFTTSNRKIARLFEKKFSFLGDDFISYDLKRVLGEVEIQAI